MKQLSLAAALLALAAAFLFVRGASVAESGEGSSSAPGEPADASGDREEANGRIEIERCRVHLIDQAVLASDQAGILDFVVPRAGERVQAGDLVAQVRDRVVRARLAIAERRAKNDAEIRYARKVGELARLEHAQAVEANQMQPGTFTELRIRQLKLAAEKSLLQLEQAEESLAVEKLKRDETRELLKSYRVEAPFGGLVREVYKTAGEAVAAGEPILELVDTRRVRVEGYVDIDQSERVSRGDFVEVRLTVPEADLEVERTVFPGRIVFVDVKVEPVSGGVKVWAEVDNKAGALKDGLTGRMRVLTSRPEGPPARSAGRRDGDRRRGPLR